MACVVLMSQSNQSEYLQLLNNGLSLEIQNLQLVIEDVWTNSVNNEKALFLMLRMHFHKL